MQHLEAQTPDTAVFAHGYLDEVGLLIISCTSLCLFVVAVSLLASPGCFPPSRRRVGVCGDFDGAHQHMAVASHDMRGYCRARSTDIISPSGMMHPPIAMRFLAAMRCLAFVVNEQCG